MMDFIQAPLLIVVCSAPPLEPLVVRGEHTTMSSTSMTSDPRRPAYRPGGTPLTRGFTLLN